MLLFQLQEKLYRYTFLKRSHENDLLWPMVSDCQGQSRPWRGNFVSEMEGFLTAEFLITEVL